MNNEYIVYAAFDSEGNCLYVGEGKPDRYKHITSGVSHVYEANKWHFRNMLVVVEILHNGLTKKEAVALEKVEITKRKPAWNKVQTVNKYPKAMKSFAIKKLQEFIKANKRYKGSSYKYTNMIKDLCNLMNSEGETTITQGQSWCSVELPIGFMSHLACDNEKYYAAMKYVFDVSKTGNIYYIKLKGWEVDE